MTNQLINGDCLEVLKTLPDNSIGLIFTDPPYALGSEVIIRKDGKPDYKKAVDFMNKWEQPDGAFWEAWFIEAFRVLKYGGRVLMFGMDRQLMLNKYYAINAQFVETQSIYWYFCSNFPKSSSLSKNLDKNAGVEREVVGKNINARNGGSSIIEKNYERDNITAPSTSLAQKYASHRYSISPLKQNCETIMVFQKPYKTGSCLHDCLAYEAGDSEITVGALDIEGNRVGTGEDLGRDYSMCKTIYTFFKGIKIINRPMTTNGRYPSQTFCDDGAGDVLDAQSGAKKATNNSGTKVDRAHDRDANVGGCSKILHRCNYDDEEVDLLNYCPKVSKSERNVGCEELAKQGVNNANFLKGITNAKNEITNSHPTLKPISLCKKVLSLFKTPNPQTVLDCFMGSGSIGMACSHLNFDFIGVEINQDYFEIAKARINAVNPQTPFPDCLESMQQTKTKLIQQNLFT